VSGIVAIERILEEELMNDEQQARVYAQTDFEEPHSRFIQVFQERFGKQTVAGQVLDLGCGPGDISIRFAKAYPDCTVHGIDGSLAMLSYGHLALAAEPVAIANRIHLTYGRLPDITLPRKRYQIIISNSLLHHLPDPSILWKTITRFAASKTLVMIMDLLRPESLQEARHLADQYAGGEPEILQRDFYNSLLASFTLKEIRQQLAIAGLEHFWIERISDRHGVVAGVMGATKKNTGKRLGLY
jgi:ubiquinone/menaquinone biosynthesis C-methylase UbiE